MLHQRKTVSGNQRESESGHQLRKERLDIEQVHARKLILLALLIAALMLGGCQVESRTVISIDDIGRASVDAQVLLDDEAAAFVGREGETPREVAENLAVSLGSSAAGYQGASRQLESEGSNGQALTGVGVRFGDLGPGDVKNIVTDSGSVVNDISIRRSDGKISFEASALPNADNRRLVETAPRNIRDLATLVLEVRLPGTIVSHNADRQTADGLEWDLIGAILDGETITANAEVTVPPGFQLSGDLGPTADSEGSEGDPVEEQGSSSFVWILPLVAGALTWLLLARRQGG